MSSRIGRIIKKYRKENDITQFELAERINLSEFYISAIETGSRRPGRDTLIKLSKEMNVPIEALLDLETEQSLKYAAEDIYNKISTLPIEKQKIVINIMDFIIDELKWIILFAQSKCKLYFIFLNLILFFLNGRANALPLFLSIYGIVIYNHLRWL